MVALWDFAEANINSLEVILGAQDSHRWSPNQHDLRVQNYKTHEETNLEWGLGKNNSRNRTSCNESMRYKMNCIQNGKEIKEELKHVSKKCML